jgi:hypothetical protein
MYIRMLTAMKLKFVFRTVSKTADECALVDSGASENFIDFEVWKGLKIGRFRLKEAIPVHNVDGTPNKQGAIDSYCWLKVKLGRKEENMKFYLTNIGKERFILGYPFLRTFNPAINWGTGELEEGDIKLETLSFRKAQKRALRTQREALRQCGRPKEGQALYIRKTTMSQRWARQGREGSETVKKVELPERYREFRDVFDDQKAERFPPNRTEDMRIELRPDAPKTINCKVYPLTRKEMDTLREFLTEEERKGYITPGSSEYTAPVFFVGKKDSSELRPVMDYRELNKWTIRDNNPLPNIGTALENLKDGELFSKFDLRWGYKNIRIKPEDCHKAAFKTQFGVYIPKVTYFGLTNAPPVFQRTMQRDLRPLLQKYPREFGNYLDDVWIVTKADKEGITKHRQISRELFEILKKHSYFLKLSKSVFEAREMDLLGWRVGNGEIRIDPDKISGLKDWPRHLKSVHEIRSTMGILGYH